MTLSNKQSERIWLSSICPVILAVAGKVVDADGCLQRCFPVLIWKRFELAHLPSPVKYLYCTIPYCLINRRNRFLAFPRVGGYSPAVWFECVLDRSTRFRDWVRRFPSSVLAGRDNAVSGSGVRIDRSGG
jgi:hypothetical protein